MKAKNLFTRKSYPIKGAEVAKLARTHAAEPADDRSKKENPQRMDILRRNALSSRPDNIDT
jgi:hypothetical protein